MRIIAGLGNPGNQYSETRHNIGFKTVDFLAGQLNIELSKKKFKALVGEGSFNNEKVILIKPQTYMNLSGESIHQAINWYKINLSNLIIIYDDVDLTIGKIRIRARGSAGTHNGMRSIVDYIQSEDFPRIRLGIGAPTIKDYDLADFVLSKFCPEEIQEVNNSIQNAAEAVRTIIQYDVDTAMNRFN